MQSLLKSFGLLFLLFACHFVSLGQKTLTFHTNEEYKIIENDYISIYEDKTNTITINELLSKQIVFNVNQELLPKNLHLSSTYWVKFKIKQTHQKTKFWLLEFPDHRMNYIELYDGNTGQLISSPQGNLYPFSNKNIQHKNISFPIKLPKGNVNVFYAKIKSGFPVGLLAKIRTYESFIDYSLVEYYLLGLFYGILLLMMIYNLLMYFSTKDNSYFYYVFYVLSIAGYFSFQDGTGFQFYWPNFPEINQVLVFIMSYTIVFFALKFTIQFLNIKQNSGLLYQIINYIIIARSVILIYTLIVLPDFSFIYYTDATLLMVAFYSGIKSYKHDKKYSKLFLVAYIFLFTGYLITLLKESRIIPNNIFTVYAFNFGVLLEMSFLSLAMTQRIREEIKEKEKAQEDTIRELGRNAILQKILLRKMKENEETKDRINKELELLVQERTKELEIANSKLWKQSVNMNHMNVELDLNNRKLQKDIVQIEKARIKGEEVSFEDFMNVYPDEYSCLEYLFDLKWKSEYQCVKCGHKTSVKGKEKFSKRCSSCGYNESATAYTIFHKLKFPLKKALYMVFLVSNQKTKITVDELSAKLDLRRNTCWNFRKKILDRLTYLDKHKIPYSDWEKLIIKKEELEKQ